MKQVISAIAVLAASAAASDHYFLKCLAAEENPGDIAGSLSMYQESNEEDEPVMVRSHWKNLTPGEKYGLKIYDNDSDVINCKDAYSLVNQVSWFEADANGRGGHWSLSDEFDLFQSLENVYNKIAALTDSQGVIQGCCIIEE